MSRKRNHAYANRRGQSTVPAAFAVVMANLGTPTTTEALQMVSLLERAVEGIATGDPDPWHWGTVTDLLAILEALVRLRVLQGRDEVLRLMQVCTVVLQRIKATGSPALYAAELADLRSLVPVWADIAATQPKATLARAESMVLARNQAIVRQLRKQGVHVPPAGAMLLGVA